MGFKILSESKFSISQLFILQTKNRKKLPDKSTKYTIRHLTRLNENCGALYYKNDWTDNLLN